MESPDKFVEDYTSNLSKTTISKSIPLWDVHLLNVKTSEAESTVIFRIHHSLGDGISLMSLLLSCSRKASDPEALPNIPTIKRRNPSYPGRLTSGKFLLKLWWLVLLCWNTIVDVLILLGQFSSWRILKRLLKTINDVMVAITQAGLSSYLNRKYGKYISPCTHNKGAEVNNNNLPNNIRLRAALAVNIRPSAGIQALVIHVVSYASKMKITLSVDKNIIPDPHQLCDDLQNSLDLMKNAVITNQRTDPKLYSTGESNEEVKAAMLLSIFIAFDSPNPSGVGFIFLIYQSAAAFTAFSATSVSITLSLSILLLGQHFWLHFHRCIN
ncbi:hypothetical protein GH714_016280 [Hevea brasiliensis]|uniref:Uncharacterized protein n=1 Tax=Hevea brasiliensis TaxID=3981 RepID=A0A6A6L9V1_HEVBR|nr:hypothetical protein GH714_016280 [Hevea brasiliensis]